MVRALYMGRNRVQLGVSVLVSMNCRFKETM
jgi:hypothetical protein